MTSARLQWRRECRASRKRYVASISTEERRRQERQLQDILLPHLGPPGVLGAYISVGSELDIGGVMQAAAHRGWRISLPRAVAGEPLTFHYVNMAELQLEAGSHRIPEPSAELPKVAPDVVLVPLIAVDRTGHRLGQGGGHYDRTLAKLRATKPILAIGIAWDMQVVAEVPAQSWDQQVDAIATPTMFHLTGAGAIMS